MSGHRGHIVGRSRYTVALAVLDDLSADLRTTRLAAGITVRAAETEIGISKATLQRLERDEPARIDLRTLRRVLEFLHRHNREI